MSINSPTERSDPLGGSTLEDAPVKINLALRVPSSLRHSYQKDDTMASFVWSAVEHLMVAWYREIGQEYFNVVMQIPTSKPYIHSLIFVIFKVVSKILTETVCQTRYGCQAHMGH